MSETVSPPAVTEERVRDALREVLDPEFPISVVDMGLIRRIEVEGSAVRVGITYTTSGCPCMEIIQEDIENRLCELEGVSAVEIEETFDSWSRNDISHKGLKVLNTLGIQ